MNVVHCCFGSWHTTWGAKDRELTKQHSWLRDQWGLDDIWCFKLQTLKKNVLIVNRPPPQKKKTWHGYKYCRILQKMWFETKPAFEVFCVNGGHTKCLSSKAREGHVPLTPTGRRFKLTQQQALPLTRYLQKIFVLMHLGSHPVETHAILAELEKRRNGPGLRFCMFHSNRGFYRPLAGQQWQHHPGDSHW